MHTIKSVFKVNRKREQQFTNEYHLPGVMANPTTQAK